MLSERPEFHLVSGDGGVPVDVLVVIEESLTAHVVEAIRCTAVFEASATKFSCVVAIDDVEQPNFLAAIAAGVTAIVLRRDLTAESLVKAILAAHGGAADLSREQQGTLLAHLRKLHADANSPHCLNLAGVDDRERQILSLLAEGKDTADIASKLCYSERTVKKVLYSMMERLGLRNRAHAVAYAVRLGLV
ncbi:helix-turn-helix transcriptional regulator [Amycolatopsis japonica]